jgi:hypothetical protein
MIDDVIIRMESVHKSDSSGVFPESELRHVWNFLQTCIVKPGRVEANIGGSIYSFTERNGFSISVHIHIVNGNDSYRVSSYDDFPGYGFTGLNPRPYGIYSMSYDSRKIFTDSLKDRIDFIQKDINNIIKESYKDIDKAIQKKERKLNSNKSILHEKLQKLFSSAKTLQTIDPGVFQKIIEKVKPEDLIILSQFLKRNEKHIRFITESDSESSQIASITEDIIKELYKNRVPFHVLDIDGINLWSNNFRGIGYRFL